MGVLEPKTDNLSTSSLSSKEQERSNCNGNVVYMPSLQWFEIYLQEIAEKRHLIQDASLLEEFLTIFEK